MPSMLRKNNTIGSVLIETYSKMRPQAKTIKSKDALNRILFKATGFLYRELLKELS